MLPLKTKQQIKRALPEVYHVPLDHDEMNGFISEPQIRWAHEEFDTPEAPYEKVTLQLDPTGVVQEEQAVRTDRGRNSLEDDVDADIAINHARRVYDVLNIQIVARGNAKIPYDSVDASTYGDQTLGDGSIGGDVETEYISLSASERAYGLAETLQSWLLNEFQTRRIDQFDPNGNAIDDDSDRIYAEDLEPPVHVRPIPGRGPNDVTDIVGASGSQYNAAVELYYLDKWAEYHYGPDDTEIETDVRQ